MNPQERAKAKRIKRAERKLELVRCGGWQRLIKGVLYCNGIGGYAGIQWWAGEIR